MKTTITILFSLALSAFAQMATIPAGSFIMGDANDFASDAPKHPVYVSQFQIDTTLVTFANWRMTVTASPHYSFSGPGTSSPVQYAPVASVDWYDAVKYCNARSELSGLNPCYFTDAAMTKVFRTGEVQVFCNWTNNGLRLPTEAEWEKAARGGLVTNRFPWGMTIKHSQACYTTPSAGARYDLGPANVVPSGPVAVNSYAPNGYGIYTMAGNLNEWCWDFWTFNNIVPGKDPTGPSGGSKRVVRGGSFQDSAGAARCAARAQGTSWGKSNTGSFRCVKR